MDKLFVPFLPPWAETGLQPAFYDLESGTVLQQTARMYDKVNQLIRLFNQLSEETKTIVEEYIAKFIELKDFVDDYFDNLDVQEEINNKLDEMVEDGTFDTILANYLVICGGNPKAYGAKGDGETDDTEAINSAITSLKEAGINKLVFPKGEYVISDSIEIPSNFVLEGMPESTLKYVGEGTDGNIISIQGEDAENYKENIVIRGITINGVGQVYKGGYSMSTPKVTHTNPCAKGLICVNARFVRNITIENCNFEDVYGDGIVIYYANNVHINRNTLRDVSSGNIQTSGQTGYDNHGDGIVTFFSFNVEMSSNTVINKRVYQDGISSAIGKPCGRSGLEFEYAINQNTPDDAPDDIDYNAPNYSEIPLVTVSSKQRRYGVGLRMTNNYVYGYTKGIHLESRVKAIIDGNTLLKNHIGIICSVDAYTTLTNNYFNPFGVGAAPQGGYDAYYSGIGVTNYADSGSRRNCLLISGNTFDGDGKGVTINNNYVTVENNKFFCQRGIFTQSANLIGINIFNNTFNSVLTVNFDYFIFLYNVKYSKIKNNTFYSEVLNSNTISGDFIEISSNEFVNTSINHNAGNGNLTIRDNTVKGNLYADHVWIINYGDKSLIDNNEFNIEDFNTSAKNIIKFSNSTADCVFSNNKFSISTTRNDLDVVRCEVVNRCKFINNYFKSNINVNFIRVYVSRSCDYINNKVENTLANVIYHTGQFEGCTVYEGNVGTLGGSGSNPNDSTSKFVNQFYSKSQKLYKYNVSDNSTEIGWICTSEGYYTTTSWSSGNSYNANSILKNASDKVYKCITKGSGASTVEPTHTTFANVTETDGYEWQYLGSVATFSTLSK